MNPSRAASAILLLVATACSAGDSATHPLAPTSSARANATAAAQQSRVPKPRLVLDSAVSPSNSNYDLTVANWSKFPDELFAPSPNLPPCGLNTSASRSWVEVFDANGTMLNGFCALGDAASLSTIWVHAPQLPITVYVEIWDRLTNTRYRSNSVKIPAP